MANAAALIEEEIDLPLDGEAVAAPERTQADIEAALAGTIGRLQGLANTQVQMKAAIEDRWLADLRQFHGRYDPTTETALKDAKKSKLFVNLTRSKVNSWEARLSDLLFPTDDKNWGIKPTPAPHLAETAKKAVQAAKDAADKATQAHQGGDPAAAAQIAARGTLAAQHSASIQDDIDEAAKRSGLMENEIETQLRTSDYNIRSRDVIRDMVRIGTGIMKGPVTSQKLRRSWAKATTAAGQPTGAAGMAPAPANDLRPWKQEGQAQSADAQAAGTAWQLDLSADPAPEFQVIDPWSYFPDMSARTPEEAEFHFERHLWNAKLLRSAVKRNGLDPEAVTELLRDNPREAVPTYWAQLQEITSNSQMVGIEKRFQVWEFHGVLEDEDLVAIADATGDQSVMGFVKDNPLLEVPVIIWFCQGKLLKFAPYPLDSCESLYSVVPFEQDDTSMFGFGVPYLMRDSQAALNGGWRMMMDNGGLAVGPQIVVDQDAIKPSDGDWAVRPMKLWWKSSTSLTKMPDGYKPFETFTIGANQAPLQNIITMARQFADDETNMPMIAAGDQASHITKTTGGMSMLMNSANVVFRRVVKNFDDCQTTPNIRRIYDWNMQFSKREDIKGDFNIDARGSSVLLVKELQSTTLMALLSNFSGHPVIGPMLKPASLLRKLVQAQMIHADDAVKSDDVIEKEAAARAEAMAKQPKEGGADPAELESREKIAAAANASREKVAQINFDAVMNKTAADHNMTLDELHTKLQINQANNDHKERIMAVELAQPNAQKVGGAEFETGAST